jgi:hypothetical protein
MPFTTYESSINIININIGSTIKVGNKFGIVKSFLTWDTKNNKITESSNKHFWQIQIILNYPIVGNNTILEGRFKYKLEGEEGENTGIIGTLGYANIGTQTADLKLITTTQIPPSWNPYSIKTIKNNYVPPSSGQAGMRLYLNNNKYSTTGASKGNVGLSAAASRAINRNGR